MTDDRRLEVTEIARDPYWTHATSWGGAMLAIVVSGAGSADAAEVNTPVAGSVSDTSASGGVTFVGECSCVLAAAGVNSATGAYAVDGATAADWPLVTTTVECAYPPDEGTGADVPE